MNDTLNIRPARGDDAEARSLLEEYFADRARSWTDPRGSYSRRPADFSDGVILVVEMGGQPVGIGGLREVPSPMGEWWEVKHMYVRAHVRRTGIARMLLAALEGEARNRGATDLVLDTHHSLVGAINLYQSAGFVETRAFNKNPNATQWFRKRLT